MEPNRLENQIKKKLDLREIQPSAQAWDRLDAMLSVAENKKPKRAFGWLFIAASMVGLVFVGLLFFQQKDENSVIQNNQTVVVSPLDINAEDEQSIKKQTIINVVENTSIVVAKKEIVPIEKIPQNYQKEKIVAQEKTTEIEVKLLKDIPKIVNPEVLLASVETDRADNENQKKSKLKIDPSALLSEVDGEIELTFRQKTIKKITKKFESTKEVLASRNQEQQLY